MLCELGLGAYHTSVDPVMPPETVLSTTLMLLAYRFHDRCPPTMLSLIEALCGEPEDPAREIKTNITEPAGGVNEPVVLDAAEGATDVGAEGVEESIASAIYICAFPISHSVYREILTARHGVL